jgi:hypothetical protein
VCEYIPAVVRRSSSAARVRTENFEKDTIFFQFSHRPFHDGLIPVSAQIREKNKYSQGLFFIGRDSILDKLMPASGKRLEHLKQHTGLIFGRRTPAKFYRRRKLW